MRKEEALLVATHRLVVSFDRPEGRRLECRLWCEVCGNVVFVSVWEEDCVSDDEARERAEKSGWRSFRYDCVSYLAASVMES
jgi:hypothetical protein